MSSSSSASPGPLPTTPRVFRPGLRQATLIIPRTGERVKRSITLRGVPRLNSDGVVNERTPFLRRSNSGLSQQGTLGTIISNGKDGLESLYRFAISSTGQSILKCSLAYLLGSMATFVVPVAAFLGRQDGKHMVATITVYFNPARSQGSMQEATVLAFLAFIYATFVSFTSMGVSILFGRWDMATLGHTIILIVFLGGGLGFVGWLKQRLENPLVNVACSLTSLAIISILTKEEAVQIGTFSYEKILQVLKMVVVGIIITTVVGLVVKPISARKELREAMIKVTDSFGDMLTVITRGFLTGSDEELHNPSFVEASNRYKSVFTSLTKNLREAKYEHYVFGTENEYHIEARLVDCMQRLTQNIGGLRSSAETQFSLLSQKGVGGSATPLGPLASPARPTTPHLSMFSSLVVSPEERQGFLAAIYEVPEENGKGGKDLVKGSEHPDQTDEQDSSLPTASSPVEIFERFMAHLGPSMKSLAYTLKQILDDLPFGPGPEYCIAVNPCFRASLVDAIELYSSARRDALRQLYQNNELNKERPMDVVADFEEVAASCGYFSYSLLDFAEEMKTFLDILDELKMSAEEDGRHSWKWLMFWRKMQVRGRVKRCRNSEYQRLHSDETSEPDLVRTQPSPRDTSSTAPIVNLKQRGIKYRLWEIIRWFHRDDKRFAVKVGVGAAIYADLLSLAGRMGPAIVHASLLNDHRILQHDWVSPIYRYMHWSDMCGSCVSDPQLLIFPPLKWSSWVISHGNPYALATLGWLMSLCCFYIILAQGKGPMGRFILLTYNLSCLYAYSLSVKDGDGDDDEGGATPKIMEITLHRVVAVMSGCLWGLFITRIIWPISARQKLQDGLSILWLRMALIWKRDPLSTLTEGESPNAYINISEELELQHYLSRLESLRASAISEFDFQGPFPDEIYARALKNTSNMLDAFHAMNVIISKDLRVSEGEAEILKFTAKERAQLCARISHLFQVLASSMKLEYPMNGVLPSTEHARDRLLAKIFRYRASSKCARSTSDEDFALLYAYALVTGQLSAEIAKLGAEVERLFGVLDEDRLKLE
ncbi:MAG: hypothetical protein M1839_000052 [Geoglossum umbratile]|nr:MAG: hypothetical protein M1839_000052 [Geoglossum umbratile]